MLTPKADATTLRLAIFASFNAWPSADQVLVKLLFRIGARLHEMYVIHQADWMANPPPNAVYVAPTANEMDDMVTDGNDPAMKACIDAISAVMLARYAKDKCTTNAQKDAARHAEIQHVSSMLLSSLLEACNSDERFCHLKELKYIVEDKLAYNVITAAMATNLWSLPGVRLLWDVIDTVNKQKLTANTSAAALFEPPDVYSSIHEHNEKIGPALRALNDAKLASAAALLDHLEAISVANFVTTCANSAALTMAYREAYQLGANDLSDLMATDPTPLTVAKMLKIIDKIRRALDDRKLPPAPTRPTKVATLARLESDVQQQPRGFAHRATRGRGETGGTSRGRVSRGGAAKGGNRREQDLSTVQCNVCAAFGHTWLVCPKGNQEMQKKEIARRAEQKARNASRALRRAKEEVGGGAAVSEDEGDEEDAEEFAAGVNHKHCSVSLPHSLTPSLTTTHTPHDFEALRVARAYCTRKAHRHYVPSPYDIPNAFPPALGTSAGEWMVNKILPLAHTPFLHAPDHITVLCHTREALPSNTKMLTFRSPEHGDSIVHMYPLQCALKNPDVGAVLDTGAQLSAAKYPAEILEHTHTSHAMQGAFGRPTTMKGILMGCSTVDIQGMPLTLVIPDESVCDPLLSDSLVSAGRLMEAGFGVIFRLPKDASTDGFHPDKYPLYGGTILTPEKIPRTIVIEYRDHTWRLPVPQLRLPDEKLFHLATHNSFAPLRCEQAAQSLSCIPEATTSLRSEADQRKFELMCSRQKQAQILHESGGHRNARDTYRDLEAAGMQVHHLKRYILGHQCKWCQANLGRKTYHCQKARQPGGDLEISTIVDQLNPKIMLTETLAKIHQITMAPDHPAWSMECDRPGACEGVKVTKRVPLGHLEAHTLKDVTKLKAFAQILLPTSTVAPEEPGMQNHSPAGTDLRIDWADACSLGRHGERYFLLVIDKGTEYLANFNTKTRQRPVALLQAYITELPPLAKPRDSFAWTGKRNLYPTKW
jgi:hypothetical protein